MSQAKGNGQVQTCPRCGNHCPADALKCGKGRKYFGVTDGGRDHGHKQKDGLARQLHRCGRFAHHADMEEGELFQALNDEEEAALRALLEKLSADWQARFGEDALSRRGHGHHGKKHHRKHEGHGK